MNKTLGLSCISFLSALTLTLGLFACDKGGNVGDATDTNPVNTTGDSSSSATGDPACADDSECQPGELCIDAVCSPGVTTGMGTTGNDTTGDSSSTGPDTGTGGCDDPQDPNCWLCQADSDCPPATMCVDGVCTGGGDTTGGDTTGGDTTGGDTTTGGDCMNPNDPNCLPCEADADCPLDQLCVDGLCEDGEGTGTGTSTGTGGDCMDPNDPNCLPCDADSDCAPGQLCVQGVCQP